MPDIRPRMNRALAEFFYYHKNSNNTLLIPDLHAPFIREDYFEFVKEIRTKWNCDKVVFLGDIMDNHYSSYHETDPDGYGALEELDQAKKQVRLFYNEFPDADICTGNHDLIPNRKSFTAGLSNKWIRTLNEVLDVPLWRFKEEHWIGDILCCHGTGRKAHTRMKQDMVSIIQGHYHSESYIQYQVGKDRKTFAMQLGCGFDNNTYGAAYAKSFPRQHVNCGVLLNNETPLIEYMPLGN